MARGVDLAGGDVGGVEQLVHFDAPDLEHRRLHQQRLDVLPAELLPAAAAQQFACAGSHEHADPALLVERSEFDEHVDPLARRRRVHLEQEREVRGRGHSGFLGVRPRHNVVRDLRGELLKYRAVSGEYVLLLVQYLTNGPPLRHTTRVISVTSPGP